MTKVLAALAMAGLLLVGSAGADVEIYEDPTGADTYTTYAFHDASQAPRPELISQVIMLGMEAMELARVPSYQADVLIAYWAGIDGELVIDTEVLGVTVDEVWREQIVQVYPIGALVMVGIDYSTNEIIWVAASASTLDRVPTRVQVAEIVLDLLASFPGGM